VSLSLGRRLGKGGSAGARKERRFRGAKAALGRRHKKLGGEKSNRGGIEKSDKEKRGLSVAPGRSSERTKGEIRRTRKGRFCGNQRGYLLTTALMMRQSRGRKAREKGVKYCLLRGVKYARGID